MNNQLTTKDQRPLTPNSHKSSSSLAKPTTPKYRDYQLDRNKQNRQKSIETKSSRSQEQIIGQNSVVEGNLKKTIISRALSGKLLEEATICERENHQKQRKKRYTTLIKMETSLPNSQPIKTSSKRNGPVVSYAACTNRGIVRTYNQDRISIILSIGKQSKSLSMPIYFFGLYDGHGGANCCDFLRDNLHLFIAKQPEFPANPIEALRKGIKQAQSTFLSSCQKSPQLDRSGSTLLATLIIGSKCYIANVGDSRAVLSSNKGKKATNLTRDHKPSDLNQQYRIMKAGGRIFQTLSQISQVDSKKVLDESIGPLRVFPGRLSVSRTIGDIQAKSIKYGGNPSVVFADPQITVFELDKEHDFIMMCTDGVFDKMNSQDMVQAAWRPSRGDSVHQFSGKAVENVVRESMNRRSLDNLSAVMIGLSGLQQSQRGLFKNKTFTTSEMKAFLQEGKGKGLR